MPREVIWGGTATVHDGGDPAGSAPRVDDVTLARLVDERDQLQLRHRLLVRDRDAVLDVARRTRAGYDALIRRNDVLRTFVNDLENDDVIVPSQVATLNEKLTEYPIPVVPPLPASALVRSVRRVGQVMDEALRRVTGAASAAWETPVPLSTADAEPAAEFYTEPAESYTEPEPDALPADEAPTPKPTPHASPRTVRLGVELRWGRDEPLVTLGVVARDDATGDPVDVGGYHLDLDWAAANRLIAKTRVARDQANGRPE